MLRTVCFLILTRLRLIIALIARSALIAETKAKRVISKPLTQQSIPKLDPSLGHRTVWLVAVFVSLAVVFLTLMPQINFWRARGSEWNGAFYSYHPDEYAYAAYVNAIKSGQSRRFNPYAGVTLRSESIGSVQFLPAYTVAGLARLLNVSTSTAFIALTPLTAFLSALVLFWLVVHILRDKWIAATLVLFVLCAGSLARGRWLMPLLGYEPPFQVPFPFLRRYAPAFGFLLFFVYCWLLWSLVRVASRGRTWLLITGTGLTFAALVFSYVYLWTAALAVLGSLIAVFALNRTSDMAVRRLLIVLALSVLALIPYAVLLLQRDPEIDAVVGLVYTHAPDVRPLSLVSLCLVIFLFVAIKQRLLGRGNETLFTLALAIAPVLMFNQQILTGHSLQPFHYEMFVANYVFLLALALAGSLLLLRRHNGVSPLVLLAVASISFAIGISEVSLAARQPINTKIDQFMPVAARLNAIAEPTGTAIVASPLYQLSDFLPSVASVAVLWAPHFLTDGGSTSSEIKERYFQQLYYSNSNPAAADKIPNEREVFLQVVFGWERVISGLSANWHPISNEEEENALREYQVYAESFNRERASRPRLGFLIVSDGSAPDLSRVDRWYMRDAGEHHGAFTLYRLTLRP